MQRKKNPSAFIRNTYNILQREDLNHIIAWSDDNHGFIIHDLLKFQLQILPQYFKHQKYTSFVRQLNMYGFHKQRHPLSENYFQHQTFRRGHNLCDIRRKPEKKKKNQEQGQGNQISLQIISQRQNNQNLKQNQQQKSQSQQKIYQPKDNQPQPNNQPHLNKKQTQIISTNSIISPTNSSQSIIQQIILQNQILTKIHPYMMLLQLKIKQCRLKQLQQSKQQEQDNAINQIIGNLKNIMRIQNQKICSFIQINAQE